MCESLSLRESLVTYFCRRSNSMVWPVLSCCFVVPLLWYSPTPIGSPYTDATGLIKDSSTSRLFNDPYKAIPTCSSSTFTDLYKISPTTTFNGFTKDSCTFIIDTDLYKAIFTSSFSIFTDLYKTSLTTTFTFFDLDKDIACRSLIWGKFFSRRFVPKSPACRWKRLVSRCSRAYMTEALFYGFGIVSIFASCLVCTFFFGCLLSQITCLKILGRDWKQRSYYLAVGLLDAYVIWNLVSGDACAMAYYLLRLVDLHCHSPWCCRVLSGLCLVTMENDGSVWAALFGFFLAPFMSVFIYSPGRGGMPRD